MNSLKIGTLVVVFASTALAQTGTQTQQQQMTGNKAAGQMAQPDISKMGPWTRKPTDEGKAKKEITEFFKADDESMKKGDFEGAASRIDFPVYMATDDSRGTPSAKEYSREQYTQMMKPFYENMPKDHQVSHKRNITVMSDNMATVVDEFTMTHGKQKLSGKGLALLVKRDGQWKWKVMSEPGWGEMSSGTGGSPQQQNQVPQK